MIGWVKDKIALAYHWFCFFLLCRQEPFTYQLTRMMVRHGVFFWLVFMAIAGWCLYWFFSGCWWQMALSISGLFFLCWLTDHLIDQVRLNADKYN